MRELVDLLGERVLELNELLDIERPGEDDARACKSEGCAGAALSFRI